MEKSDLLRSRQNWAIGNGIIREKVKKMGLRVTDNMKINSAINILFKTQKDYNELMVKMASQKRINRISDDPLGAANVLGYKQTKTSIDQYCRNIDNNSAWVALTESKLTSAGDLLSQARELAVAQGTATATATTRSIAAQSVQAIIDQMRTLANAQFGDRYVFSGSATDVEPFSETASGVRIEAEAAAGNTFDGTVTATGTYSGAMNKTYVVKIVNDGASYQVSDDGGKTWGGTEEVADLQGSVQRALGTGAAITNTTTWENIFTGALRGGTANTKTTVAGGGAIASTTKWNEINTGGDANDIAGGETIRVQGLNHSGVAVDATYTITDPAESLSTFLGWLETQYGGATAVDAYFDSSGRLILEDKQTGSSRLSVGPVNCTGTALSFGTFGNNITTGDTITISGTKHDGTAITTTAFSITKADQLDKAGGFLETIENLYGGAGVVDAYVSDGTDGNIAGQIVIEDLTAGDSQISLSLSANNQGGGTLDLSADIVLGDGITLTLGAGVFAENDVFYVNGYTAGYYNGNGEDLQIQIGKGAVAEYNVTGELAFTDRGEGEVDIFTTLNDLKTAMEGNQADQILAQLDKLQTAQTQVSLCVSKCGSQSNRLEMAKNGLLDMQQEVANLISDTEDADIAEVAIKFSMKEMALKASYEMASRIGQNTLLDFLR